MRSVRRLPIFVVASSKFVVLLGSSYASRCWCMLELFVFNSVVRSPLPADRPCHRAAQGQGQRARPRAARTDVQHPRHTVPTRPRPPDHPEASSRPRETVTKASMPQCVRWRRVSCSPRCRPRRGPSPLAMPPSEAMKPAYALPSCGRAPRAHPARQERPDARHPKSAPHDQPAGDADGRAGRYRGCRGRPWRGRVKRQDLIVIPQRKGGSTDLPAVGRGASL